MKRIISCLIGIVLLMCIVFSCTNMNKGSYCADYFKNSHFYIADSIPIINDTGNVMALNFKCDSIFRNGNLSKVSCQDEEAYRTLYYIYDKKGNIQELASFKNGLMDGPYFNCKKDSLVDRFYYLGNLLYEYSHFGEVDSFYIEPLVITGNDEDYYVGDTVTTEIIIPVSDVIKSAKISFLVNENEFHAMNSNRTFNLEYNKPIVQEFISLKEGRSKIVLEITDVSFKEKNVYMPMVAEANFNILGL